MSNVAKVRLKDLHSDQTESLILQTAIELMERGSVPEMTARGIARKSGISERTIFRYFSTRDALLDGVAKAVVAKLKTPLPPKSYEELIAYPDRLFGCFEENSSLTKAALHSDIFFRIQNTTAKARWAGVQTTIDERYFAAPARVRKFAAANIRHLLSATTWHYYRFFFGFSAEETVASIRQSLFDTLYGLERS